MAWGDSKCAPLWAILLYSMMTRPAIAAERATSLMAAWTSVPFRFCSFVWVGCRTRAPCVKRSMAACRDGRSVSLLIELLIAATYGVEKLLQKVSHA